MSLSYQTPLINQSLPTSSNSSVSSDSSRGNHDNIYGKDHHNGMSRYHYHSMPPWGAVNMMAAISITHVPSAILFVFAAT